MAAKIHAIDNDASKDIYLGWYFFLSVWSEDCSKLGIFGVFAIL